MTRESGSVVQLNVRLCQACVTASLVFAYTLACEEALAHMFGEEGSARPQANDRTPMPKPTSKSKAKQDREAKQAKLESDIRALKDSVVRKPGGATTSMPGGCSELVQRIAGGEWRAWYPGE